MTRRHKRAPRRTNPLKHLLLQIEIDEGIAELEALKQHPGALSEAEQAKLPELLNAFYATGAMVATRQIGEAIDLLEQRVVRLTQQEQDADGRKEQT